MDVDSKRENFIILGPKDKLKRAELVLDVLLTHQIQIIENDQFRNKFDHSERSFYPEPFKREILVDNSMIGLIIGK